MLFVLSKLAGEVILVLGVIALFVREGIGTARTGLGTRAFEFIGVDVDFLRRHSELKTRWRRKDWFQMLVSGRSCYSTFWPGENGVNRDIRHRNYF